MEHHVRTHILLPSNLLDTPVNGKFSSMGSDMKCPPVLHSAVGLFPIFWGRSSVALASRVLLIVTGKQNPVPSSHRAVDVYSKSHKSKYQRKCCNKSVSIGNPSNGGTTTPKLPPYEGPVGNAPDCPICRTKEYPGKPNQFIIARYVGEFSCAQLFMRGYHGLISKTMCGPLQDYAYSVCGCGIYNPACSSDSEKCWGGSKYKAPYIIDYSALTTSSSTARNAGKRHLRGVDAGPQVISTTPMNPEDLHFEAMEQGEEDEDMEMIEEEEDEMIESPEDEEDR